MSALRALSTIALVMLVCATAPASVSSRALKQALSDEYMTYLSSVPGAMDGARGRFLRKHVNDLDALLRFVSNGPIVSFTLYNTGYRQFAAVSRRGATLALLGWATS